MYNILAELTYSSITLLLPYLYAHTSMHIQYWCIHMYQFNMYANEFSHIMHLPPYFTLYIPIRMNLSYSSRMPAGEPLPRGELVPNSLHYLFLWCLFMSHIQLAKIVWESTHVRSHVFQAPLSSSDTDMVIHRAACLPCIFFLALIIRVFEY